jgi:hypothetical protein
MLGPDALVSRYGSIDDPLFGTHEIEMYLNQASL